jgi:hypothetical protein
MDPKKIMTLNIPVEQKSVLLELNIEINRLISFVRNSNELGKKPYPDLVEISESKTNSIME